MITFLTNRTANRLLGASLTALAGFVLSYSQPLANKSYELLFRFRPPIDVSAENAVIVYMDDESAEKLGEHSAPLWKRSLHKQLIEQLHTNRAEVIVFDIFFRDPDKADENTDRQLLAAAEAHGKVLFAAIYQDQLTPDGQLIGGQVRRPFKGLVKPEAVGLVQGAYSDLAIRRHSPDILGMPSLSWKAAEMSLASPPGKSSTPRWVNYYGPPDKIPHVSYWQVLSNSLPPSITFTKQVVFVGARTTIEPRVAYGTDFFHTPFGQAAPGVEVSAIVYLNLARGDWLRRWPESLETMLFIVLGMAGGWFWTRRGVKRSACVAGLAILITLALAIACFWAANFWFPWLIIVAGQIPVAFACALVGQVRAAEILRAAPAPIPTEVASATGTQNAAREATRIIPAISDHTLLRCIGQGSYGEVWLARNIVGVYRAVKMIHRHRFPAKEPYDREFRGIEKYTPISLSHPGWVPILHVGRDDQNGFFFYIMELGDDEVNRQQIDPFKYRPKTLAGELRPQGKLPLADCVSLGLALADALEHLHQHGLVHRDIKPSNVIFIRGQPRFADIGLVTEIRTHDRATSYVGTEGYIAPEGPGAPSADVYGLGIVLYEISTGRDRQDFPEPTVLPQQAGERHWPQFREILLKACEPQAAKRYPSALALHSDLLKFQQTHFPTRP